jgi:hypothetical protein
MLTISHSAIKYQMAIIQSHKNHGFARNAADSAKDTAEIAASFRALSYLFDAFQVSSDCGIPRWY